MGVEVVFIGVKFIYNQPLYEYVIRTIKRQNLSIDSIVFFKEGNNDLFVILEKYFASSKKVLCITTQHTFKTVSKLISTIVEDSLVLQQDMLVPSSTKEVQPQSYLIEKNDTIVNVLKVSENEKIPSILIEEKPNVVLQIFDQTQESLQTLLEPLSQTYEVKFEMTTLIPGWVELVILTKRYGNSIDFAKAVQKLLTQKVLICANIMEYIIEVLSKEKKTITFAESCTGGLLSYFLTKNNGASKILNGSLITYANHIKESWLAVDEKSLEQFGAVSAKVVEEMSEGALGVSEADFAISVSGIAGDGGGSIEKPVGTVYINVRSKEKDTTLHLQLQGDRNYVQYQSVLFGIKTLLLENKALFFK